MFGETFASKLFANLNVPVAIVLIPMGNSALGSWFKSYDAEKSASGEDQQQTTKEQLLADHFQARLAKFEGFPIKGILCSQGEEDARLFRAQEYRHLFPSLIRNLRAKWNYVLLPFLYLQLPRTEADDKADFPGIRAAQTYALNAPGTGMATTLDLPFDARNRSEFASLAASRVADLALRDVYSQNVTACKNLIPEIEWVADGVLLKPPLGETFQGKPTEKGLEGFDLRYTATEYQPATGEWRGNNVFVARDAKAGNAFIRYAWRNDVAPSLFDDGGLPVPPFSSSDAGKYVTNKVETDEKVIALTFDDGPDVKTTSSFLAILERLNSSDILCDRQASRSSPYRSPLNYRGRP